MFNEIYTNGEHMYSICQYSKQKLKKKQQSNNNSSWVGNEVIAAAFCNGNTE